MVPMLHRFLPTVDLISIIIFVVPVGSMSQPTTSFCFRFWFRFNLFILFILSVLSVLSVLFCFVFSSWLLIVESISLTSYL